MYPIVPAAYGSLFFSGSVAPRPVLVGQKSGPHFNSSAYGGHSRFIWQRRQMSLFLRWCWPTCAFRWTQVTRLQAARVDHQLLEHDARVDHPELQYMFARLIELVLAGRDIGVVGDRSPRRLPRAG